jgi:hypothetical protein
MNGHSNIFSRLRRRKAGVAVHAMALFLTAQLTVALTPCFAIAAASGGTQADGGAAAATSHASHAGAVGTGHADHAAHAAHAPVAPEAAKTAPVTHATQHFAPAADPTPAETSAPHCPHCPDGVANPGVAQDGQQRACATVENVDTAPQASAELSLKPLHAIAESVHALPRPAAVHRASPPREPPHVPTAVPLNIRHCVFLI